MSTLWRRHDESGRRSCAIVAMLLLLGAAAPADSAIPSPDPAYRHGTGPTVYGRSVCSPERKAGSGVNQHRSRATFKNATSFNVGQSTCRST